MRKLEKIKFFIYGFFTSLTFFVLVSFTTDSSNQDEVGRYQVITRSSDHYYVYTVILDTKTGDFIEGEGSNKAFKKKKNIDKGNFSEIFNDAEVGK